jgi:serine/threonine-protein kinase HipA
MTSDAAAGQAYVWIWLPQATSPVVAGLLTRQDDGRLLFNYGRSYLERDEAIAIYEPELPLRPGAIEPPERMQMPSAIRDGSPDAWGRRVIINRLTGLAGRQVDAVELDCPPSAPMAQI